MRSLSALGSCDGAIADLFIRCSLPAPVDGCPSRSVPTLGHPEGTGSARSTALLPHPAEPVVQRSGVVGLDVIHHVSLADVDRVPVGEVDSLDGLLTRPALGHRHSHRGYPLHEHAALNV